MPADHSAPVLTANVGVKLAGTGMALPEERMTNARLEELMETSDDWIVQRTGVHERRIARRENGVSTSSLGAAALSDALKASRLEPTDLDLVIVATMTPEMSAPSTACQVIDRIGAAPVGGYDLSGACSGFVYAMSTAYSMIRTGLARTIGVIGVDTVTQNCRYDNEGRGTAILFGDGAGAAVLRATDDPACGMIAGDMHTDGGRWKDLYVPSTCHDAPEGTELPEDMLRVIQMNGRAVFKFAVGTFQEIIATTLEKAGVEANDVDMYVCHQSNARILGAARERFGIDEEKLYINISHYGNTVAASVPLCLHELMESGRIKDGDLIMFVAFGAGLTWGSCLWRV